jgi:hypothetical protein
MKTQISKRRNYAMTLFEVAVVIAAITILAAILLPAIRAPHSGVQRINCINNLKQIGLSFRIWEGDNNDLYPTKVSVTNGGAMELVATGNAAAVFQVMSNELSTPKILVCPEDKNINSMATNFSSADLKNKISYFAGLDATNDFNPQLLLSGDDNFLLNGSPIKSGLVEVASNSPFAWDDTRHVYVTKTGWFSKSKTSHGNIALGDDSVQQVNQNTLKQTIQQTGFVTNHFAIP